MDEIKHIKRIGKNNKWQILIKDHTPEGCPMKVVRVVVPAISDILKFKFDKEIFGLDLPLSGEDYFMELSCEEKFEFLKYKALPEWLISYKPLSLPKLLPLNCIKELLRYSQASKNYDEISKLQNIFRQTPVLSEKTGSIPK